MLDGPGAVRIAPLYDLLSIAAIEGASRDLAMKYGGEKRTDYLRRRHLRRLGEELEVRPALVERRATRMIDRVLGGGEDARRALPPEFQDRSVLERVSWVISERSARLMKALSEPDDG